MFKLKIELTKIIEINQEQISDYMAIQFGSRFLLWLQPMAYSRGPFQQVVEYAWQNSGPPPGIIKSKTFKA